MVTKDIEVDNEAALERWEERMKKRAAHEEEEAPAEQERLRQCYLVRTGRTELRP